MVWAARLLFLSLTLSVHAQTRDSERHRTGLLPPTPAEREWLEKNAPKASDVKLNKLAVQRINAYRRSQGLPTINPPVVPFGEEVVFGQPVRKSTASIAVSLPPAVDNSTLPSFPPIRNQGELGSCVSFSSVYYLGTHTLGFARGWNNKNDDNSTKLSPKWTYNLVNNGQDEGSGTTPTFVVLLKHGAATLADVPYLGTKDNPANYLEWSRDSAVWRKAISYRFDRMGSVQNLDTTAGLNDLKKLLRDGYVLVFGSDINGWEYLAIGDDPSTAEDNGLVGRRICAVVRPVPSGHAMTIVGYNDHIWVDLNKNGVVDAGEKGALRIANSWGTGWLPGGAEPGDGGFTWIAYDALKKVSAVPGVDNSNRSPGDLEEWRTPFQHNSAWFAIARSAYTPKLLAQFTLTHPSRYQLNVRLGWSSSTETRPSGEWEPGALQKQGGDYAFDGTENELNGTFVFDLSDLTTQGAGRYYLSVEDAFGPGVASITDFRLIDAAGNTLAVAKQGIPGTADESTAVAYVDYGLAPLTVTSKETVDGTAGIPFSFTVTATGNPTTFSAVGLPRGLAIDSKTGLISGTPTESGTFTVSLSVSSPSGTGSGALTIKVEHPPMEPPVITSDTKATGTVGVAFNYAIKATGSPTSYGADNLPQGLKLDSATGVISGIPTDVGTFTVPLTASNVGGHKSRALTVTINPPAAGAPVITSPTTASVRAGSPFSYRILASNNPSSYSAEGLPSQLTLNAASGLIAGTLSLARQYTIALSAKNGAGVGYVTLVLDVLGDSSFAPANDSFANRSSLVGRDLKIKAGNNNATAEKDEPKHAGFDATSSVWWTWTAPAAGKATLSTVGSNFDTVLAVYTGSELKSLIPVASDDDSGGVFTSRLSFDTTAGTSYQIAVDAKYGDVGNIVLNLQSEGTVVPPANDNFENRINLSGASVSVEGRNLGATAQPDEPNHGKDPPGKSIWWSWTAPSSGVLTVSTAKSDFATILAIYTSTDPPRLSGLTQVTSDDQSGPNNTSVATLLATQGTTYYIAVDGFGGKEGNAKLSLQLAPGTLPPNDNFENRITLTGTSISTNGFNLNATAQVGEPIHASLKEARASVWWSWTSPADGVATIDTAGSNFDTVLAVYTGPNLSELSVVASNDDWQFKMTSSVTFPAASGTTYHIAVDGVGEFNNGNGSVSLNVRLQTGPPPNDDFANRAVLGGRAPATVGANVNAGGEKAEPKGKDAPADKSVWWSWTAPASGRMTFTTAGTDFDTVMAIFTGTSLTNLTFVAGNDDDGDLFTSLATFWATAGTTYYIAVDGYNGASGPIELSGDLVEPGDALYETDFDTFAVGGDELVGADGWQSTNADTKVQGIIDLIEGLGHSAYLGYSPPTNRFVSIFRPVNFDPVGQKRPLVNFSVDLGIADSTNDKFDIFAFTLYNRAGQFLASLIFNNANGKILYANGENSIRDTGQTFENDTVLGLNASFNFAAKKWSATLDDTVLFQDQPINVDGRTLDLGDISVEWQVVDAKKAGDNFLVFDNYSITASAGAKPPSIISQPQSRTVPAGAVATLSVTASGTLPLTYQWLFNGKALPGATNDTLVLFDFQASRAGAYTVTVRNQVGSVTSAPAVLSLAVNTPPKVTLTSPAVGASFTAPATLRLAATANDTDGTVSKVEFYQGSTKLSEDTTAPYTFTWSNVRTGTYQLRARAIDNAGATTDSPVVTVVVSPGAAASVIKLAALKLDAGAFQIRLTASPGNYVVQRSTDLVKWNDLKTVTVAASGSVTFEDSVGPAQSRQAFYRVKLP